MKRLVPFLAVIALAACDDSAGPVTGGLTADEVDALSGAMVDSDFAATNDVAVADQNADVSADPAVALAPNTASTEFTVTRTCPVSGQVLLEGTHTRVWDRETHSGSSDLSVTKTHEACARLVRTVTVTVNGDPNIAVQAHHEWEGGHRSGIQTLDIEGAFTWSTDDGREGSCSIDIEAVFDPETSTRTVSGTVCDRTIDATTTWQHDGMGGGGAA